MIAGPARSHQPAAEGLYVYCIAGAGGSRLLGPIGLDGQAVYAIAAGGLRAVVHNCPAEPYQSPDPHVVEGWVVAHQDVILAAGEAFGTVLPMAFDMIVRGGSPAQAAAALREWLEARHERFARLLERLAGRAEYGVQVLWDRQALAASLIEADADLRRMQEQIRGKPKGLAHLLQRKLGAAVRGAMEKQADRFAQDFYARIRRCAEDVRVDPLRRADAGEQMLLNLSCLMPPGSGELGRALDDIRRVEGVSVRFTGPWPPYSFVGG